MSIMLDPVSKKDDDYSQLLVQNKALKSELMQCQADKDFVWSLWKRLQVSNPDVTEAISLVIQREKDKAEAKDHKVLEILQVKDNRIEELQNIVAKQALEISELLSKKVTLQEQNGKLHAEAEQLQDKLTTLELRMKGFETKERSMDDTFRRTVEESQHEKHELQRKVTALTTELEIAREEKASVSAKRLDLERTVRNLERDVSEKIPKFDGLIKELEETRMQADKAERQIHQFTQEVDFKNRELESIRKELKELWNNHNQLTEHSAQQAELIRQLQSLQHDTQIMIKNQEDAFSVESKSFQQMYSELSSRYEFSKQTETELRQESLQLKKNLMDRDDTIANLQNQIQVLREQLMRSNYGGSFLDGDLAAVDSSTLEARRDLDALRQLERTIGQLDQSFDHAEGSVEFDMSHTQKLGRHSTPGEAGQQTSRGQSVETRLLDTQKLLELKCKELEAIKQAHSRRLERLRAVQNSEKLLRDQLKTYEDHQPIRKKKKLQRINPKLLQHEDSDAVWNELAYFKSQCRTLEVERLNLQEQLDDLKVQAAGDGATVHELKISLQSQQEEFEYQLRKRDAAVTLKTEQESELMLLKSRLQNKDLHIGKLEKDLHELAMDRDTLLEEKKLLKNQANELQQELSKSRIQLADLRHTVQSQQHALEDSAQALAASACGQREVPVLPEIFISNKPARNRPTHRVRKLKHTSSAVKRYQYVLDKSIERMRSMFSHFKEENLDHVSVPMPTTATEDLENDSEWEEESDDNTEATAESLGMAIARQASQTSPNIKNTNSAVSVATNKLSVSDKIWHKVKKYPRKTGTKLKESQTRTNNQYLNVNRRSPADSTTSAELSPRVPDRVVLREVATSPIPWGASGQIKAKTANNRSGLKVCARQLTTLKQRISNLQQQLTSLRESRTAGLKLIADLKENNQQLTLDLSQANHRLRSAKQTCQRLTAELERLQHEKVNTDKQLSEHDPMESSIKQNDSDRHLLEVKLKMSSSEVARQAATIRTLKTEAETLQDQIRGLQDRVNHLERDNNQKRNLLESQRIKMKAAQDAGKVHEDAMEELQTKLKLTTESLEKIRIQLESMKKRMRVVTKEKRDYEDKYLQVSLSLEKKTKELSICREQRAELEAGVTQLESLSQQQLQRLATHSEAAVDAAQAQVTAAHTILTRYQQFVKLLATEILDRVIHSRKQLREAALQEEQAKSTQDSDVSLKRAQDTARNILNISQSDLDDIMSADGDHEAQESHSSGEDRRDKKWLRRCEKVIKSKEDFVGPLLSLILQKVDERADLMVRLTL